jgi:hypothetical protein
MRKRLLLLASVAAAFVGVGVVTLTANAVDHKDSAQTAVDNAADIAGVYAFMRPEPDTDGGYKPSSYMTAVMTFAPGATGQTRFDAAVDYTFRFMAVNGSTLAPQLVPNFKIKCNFSATAQQEVTCSVGGIVFKTTRVGAGVDAGAPTDPVRIYAGLNSDPAFADIQALSDSVASGSNKLKTPGTNAFKGANVLALVVEFDLKRIARIDASAPGPLPIFAVAAETARN